ncbi:MAG TPA: imidazolonepropionase [Panacibacter sp.]|nr:imidazolonepropionase [Panacibacter sp.]
MQRQVITNISCLVNVRSETHVLRGKELAILPCIENAYLVINSGLIEDYGSMQNMPATFNGETTNAKGATILPCWCDSHTHLVFAASREAEFVDKIKGTSYAEIAAKGGGILNSARKLNDTPEDILYTQAWNRLQELIRLGTGAIEIKSGYGLTLEGELKMLRVIKKLKANAPIPIKATFLGAHAFPAEYKENRQGYIDLIMNEMLPKIAAENLADYIDVFCEEGFFSAEETETICRAGMVYGLKPRLHVNQLYNSGGVQVGAKLNAVSLDHLETLGEEEIQILAGLKASLSGEGWRGISTLLPTAAYFLRMHFQPARQLIDAGCAVALASDFNPGSSPSGNMNTVVSMSCIQMKMLPEEAINAATINGAYAMELGSEAGSITAGKRANLIFTKPIPSLAYLPYSFGSNLIDKVMINGKEQPLKISP